MPPLPGTRRAGTLLRGVHQRDDHQLHDIPIGGTAADRTLAAQAPVRCEERTPSATGPSQPVRRPQLKAAAALAATLTFVALAATAGWLTQARTPEGLWHTAADAMARLYFAAGLRDQAADRALMLHGMFQAEAQPERRRRRSLLQRMLGR